MKSQPLGFRFKLISVGNAKIFLGVEENLARVRFYDSYGVGESLMVREVDQAAIRRWRRRGFYSETVLVRFLEKNGYKAVRIPVSNPSLSPLPDVIARKGRHVYAFEVKNARYYAYFPRKQVEKLFRFLCELIPSANEFKHAVLAAHLGKKWIFKQIKWEDWEKNKLPEKERIIKRDRGNFDLKKGS